MSKRTKVAYGMYVLVVVAPIALIGSYTGTSFEKTMTDAEVQQKLDEALQRTRVSSIRIESLKVHFRDNVVHVDTQMRGEMMGRVITAHIVLQGNPEYQQGSLYLRPTSQPQIKSLEIKSESKHFEKTTSILKEKIEKYAEKHGLSDTLDTFRKEARIWAAEKTEEALHSMLTNRAIYTLPNTASGIVVKAALEKVEIVDNKLVATFSLSQLGYSVFVAIVCLVVAISIAIFLLMNPGWGMLFSV